MKIRLSTISPDGLTIDDTIPLEALNTRMQSGSESSIVFVSAPQVKITVRPLSGSHEVKGEIIASYRQPCSRCIIEVPREMKIPLELILKPVKESEELEDDVGVHLYEGDHVDLEELIQEEIILHLDIFWAPELDPDGKCSQCGEKKIGTVAEKSGRTFGELLKKAGIVH